MKFSQTQIIVIGLALLICGGAYGLQTGMLDINPGGSDDPIPSFDMVAVTRSIKFVVKDKWAGTPATSATLKIYKGTDLQESLTTDGTTGIVNSGSAYTSGDKLNILLIKSDSKLWQVIEVPKMAKSDVEAVSVNPVGLDFFTLDTSMTLKVVDGLGNAYSTTDSLNFTALGVTQTTLTVSGYISADNLGFKSCVDPLNGINWNVVTYGKLSGTNYELITLTGWDKSYPKGLAIYGAEKIPDLGVTKYKSGNDYIHPGTFSFTLTLNQAGYSGDAADLDIDVVAYSDPNYHESYGSYGPDYVAMASSFKLNLVD